MSAVFISHATSDRKEAMAVCEAIERRGTPCWIACRDVQPGENYQEAIVRAIRNARALVLVFSDRANNSDEIKKELSLVSRFRLPLIALRIEDVEPSDAFAYELATRQWIDLFEDWDRSLDTLVRRVDEMAPPASGEVLHVLAPPVTARPDPAPSVPQPITRKRSPASWGALAALALVVVLAAGWFLLRPAAKAEHPMEVRLAGFQRLSPDLPDTLPDAMRDELISTFQDDGLIGISTAKAPRPGDAPAYSLGATARHVGNDVRVIVTVVNERSGATLWSGTYDYPFKDVARTPRAFALDTGNAVRTTLFAASTYPKALPDEALSLYFQGFNTESPTKQLDLARKLVALVPDFSWGWTNLMGGALNASLLPGADQKALFAEAGKAADTALKLDPGNSEALTGKSYLVDPNDLAAREALFKQAIKARPLVCGCEHHEYGLFLVEVGRIQDAIGELKRSTDVMPLNPNTQGVLGLLLQQTGDAQAAKAHLDAAVDLITRPFARDYVTLRTALATHDYAAAIAALATPGLPVPAAAHAPWTAAFRALAAHDPAAEAAAAPAVVATIGAGSPDVPMGLLGALGDYRDAFRLIPPSGRPNDYAFRTVLFFPGMEGAIHDPGFPALVEKMGLMRYWRQAKIKPDFCGKADAPPLCKTI